MSDANSPYPPFKPPGKPFHGCLPCDPVLNALAEDLGGGDLTSDFFIPANLSARARIVAKEPAVVSGLAAALETFLRVDPSVSVTLRASDGASVTPGEVVLETAGPARSLLSAERVALNLLQRLSGVATLTRRFVEAVAGTPARVVDTRKTTPGLRALEKQAVRHGGGLNHRAGLYDAVMIKDNHIAALGGLDRLPAAIAAFKHARPGVMIEVEADTPEQAAALFRIPGIDVILLDNMPPDQMAALASRRPAGLWLEASGGVTLATVPGIARTGVDFISVGALTHSARAVDFSMELDLLSGPEVE